VDDKIVWMISAYAQKQNGFNCTVGHWPLSREAYSVAEAKGLALEWLEEHKPHSDGWQNYSINACPVFTNDHNRLVAEGRL
jgi:hypothetical protein